MAFCVFYLRPFFQGQDDFTSTKQRSNGADTEKETVPSVTRAAVVTTSGMLMDSNYPLKFIFCCSDTAFPNILNWKFYYWHSLMCLNIWMCKICFVVTQRLVKQKSRHLLAVLVFVPLSQYLVDPQLVAFTSATLLGYVQQPCIFRSWYFCTFFLEKVVKLCQTGWTLLTNSNFKSCHRVSIRPRYNTMSCSDTFGFLVLDNSSVALAICFLLGLPCI